MFDGKEPVILGDLNYNYVLDENLSKNPIMYIENFFKLRQIVQSPTRVTCSSSSTIDIILTSFYEKHVKTGVTPLTLSDHYLIYTVIDARSGGTLSDHKIVKYRDYKNFDLNVFLQDVRN